MIFKDMHDQVKFWLGLQEIVAYDESALINNQLLYGTIDLLARTRCTVRCVHLNVVPDVDTYVLDDSILSLVDLEDGARRRVSRDTRPGQRPVFTLIRSDVLRIAPTPTENGVVDVWAVMAPLPMVADTDSPVMDQFGGVPVDYHDAIVTYALWKCSDYADDASGQQGERYRMLYEGQDGRGGRLAQIRGSVNKRGTAKAPGRRVRLSGVAPKGNWVG